MQKTFLEDTLTRIKNTHASLSEVTIILPSKRAGGFLRNYLRTSTNETAFAPRVISIEEFIEELSSSIVLSDLYPVLLLLAVGALDFVVGLVEVEASWPYTAVTLGWATSRTLYKARISF